MRNLNKISGDNDVLEQGMLMGEADPQKQAGSQEQIEPTPTPKSAKWNIFKRLSYVMGGDMLSKDGFVGLMPFFFYFLEVGI